MWCSASDALRSFGSLLTAEKGRKSQRLSHQTALQKTEPRPELSLLGVGGAALCPLLMSNAEGGRGEAPRPKTTQASSLENT